MSALGACFDPNEEFGLLAFYMQQQVRFLDKEMIGRFLLVLRPASKRLRGSGVRGNTPIAHKWPMHGWGLGSKFKRARPQYFRAGLVMDLARSKLTFSKYFVGSHESRRWNFAQSGDLGNEVVA